MEVGFLEGAGEIHKTKLGIGLEGTCASLAGLDWEVQLLSLDQEGTPNFEFRLLGSFQSLLGQE